MRNEEGKEIWEGYCIDFIQKLSEVMQFDYDLVIPEDLEFGRKLPNGEWNGLIGDLARGVGCIFLDYFSKILSRLCADFVQSGSMMLLDYSRLRIFAGNRYRYSGVNNDVGAGGSH